MAIVSESTFKTHVATMATALTSAWKDSVKTEVAASIRNPANGLRKIEKFFNFNAGTGVVSADDDYIEACYDGLIPSKGNQLNVVSTVAMALSTATVENAAPTKIILTFAERIRTASNISVGGATNTVGDVSISDTVVTITTDTAYVSTDTITVTGTFTGHSLNSILLAAESVTNNIAPTVVSMTVESADPNDLVVVFNEIVNATNIGYTFRVDAGARTLDAVAGSGTTTLTFTIADAAITSANAIDLSYNSATGDTLNASGDEVDSFTQDAVTNNVAPVVSSLTVENAAPNDLVVVFNEIVTATNIGYAFRVDAGARTLDAVSGSGTTTLTFTISGAAIVSTNTIDLTYDSVTGDTLNAVDVEVVSYSQDSVTNNLAPTVVSMTVTEADPNDLVVVFNELVNATNIGYAFRVDAGARTLDAVAGTGTTTLTFTISGAAITSANVIDLSYDSGTGDTLNAATIEVVSFTEDAVTNDVAPVVVSMTVEDAAPNDLVVTFNEIVTATNLGYAFRVDAGARTLDAVSGSGTAILTFTIAAGAIVNGESLDLTYDSGTGDTLNAATIEVVSFSQDVVTNNVAP